MSNLESQKQLDCQQGLINLAVHGVKEKKGFDRAHVPHRWYTCGILI